MKKKLVVMLFAAVFILGIGLQTQVNAENQIPRPTSVKPIYFTTLDK